MAALQVLLEIVEEYGDALKSGFALALNLNAELDFRFAYATQVLYVVKFCNESYSAACNYGLAKTHALDAVVYEHLDVSHLDDLLPEIWQNGKCEISVSDG